MQVFLLAVILAPLAVNAACINGNACCLGQGVCNNVPDFGSCCGPQQACCSTTADNRPGSFTCCAMGLNGFAPQKCLPTGSGSARSCQAVTLVSPRPDVCIFGGSIIHDATNRTITCGNSYPNIPCDVSTGKADSYCDYSSFPLYQGNLGSCCTETGKDNSPATCAQQSDCKSCTEQECTWTADETCASACPTVNGESPSCVTEADKCAVAPPPSDVPGTCYGRCWDIGAVRLGIAPQIFYNQPQVGFNGGSIPGLGGAGNQQQLLQLIALQRLGLGGLGLGLGGYNIGLGQGIGVSPSIYCSCDNQCQRYGDCCYDIQDFCSITQIDTAGRPL